jgi:hypothetical protein
LPLAALTARAVFFDDRGKIQLANGLRGVRDGSQRERDRAALLIRIHAKAPDARNAGGEVRLAVFAEFLHLLRRHQLLREGREVLRAKRRQRKRREVAVDAQCRRTSDLQMQVGRVQLHHLLKNRLEVECGPRRLWRRRRFLFLRDRRVSHWDQF